MSAIANLMLSHRSLVIFVIIFLVLSNVTGSRMERT